jgi:hypothetical protein
LAKARPKGDGLFLFQSLGYYKKIMEHFYHGYLLVGDREEALNAGFKMATKILGVVKDELNKQPDFLFLKRNLFTIDDARRIRNHSSKKPFLDKGRVFLIEANFFSKEALNALLKTLEEPGGLNYFLIITSSIDNILPTLRSRLIVMRFSGVKELPEAKKKIIRKFLKSSPPDRVEICEDAFETKSNALDFFDSLECVLAKDLRKNLSSQEVIFSLQEIDKQRQRLLSRGSSLKMVLEHVCFALPKI